MNLVYRHATCYSRGNSGNALAQLCAYFRRAVLVVFTQCAAQRDATANTIHYSFCLMLKHNHR